MRGIYSQATRVVVWLGPSDSTSDRAMKVLQSLYRSQLLSKLVFVRDEQQNTELQLVLRDPPRTPLELADQYVCIAFAKMFGLTEMSTIQINGVPTTANGFQITTTHFPIKAVANLLSRAYWGRGWCWQEYAVANKVSIHCGSEVWENGDQCIASFLAISDFLRDHTRRDPWIHDHRPWSMAGLRYSYQSDPNAKIPAGAEPFGGEKLTMKVLLQESSTSWLTTSRKEDYILALKGVAVDADQLITQADCMLRWEHLYTKLMAAYVRQGDLWFLHCCQGTLPDRPKNLPSWVPDWPEGLRTTLLSRHYSPYPDRLTEINARLGKHAPRVEEDRYLHLGGIVVDEITWVSPPRPIRLNNLLANPTSLPLPLDTLENAPDEELGSHLDYLFSDIVDNWLRDCVFDHRVDIWNLDYKPLDPTTEGFLRCLMNATTGRSVFKTKSGRLGLGLDGIKVGQAIAVLAGVEAPFVVQRVGPPSSSIVHCRVICEAYVHGLMEDSELIAIAPANKIVLV